LGDRTLAPPAATGGTAPKRVREQLDAVRERVHGQAAWASGHQPGNT
jgi:hypothetical protein